MILTIIIVLVATIFGRYLAIKITTYGLALLAAALIGYNPITANLIVTNTTVPTTKVWPTIRSCQSTKITPGSFGLAPLEADLTALIPAKSVSVSLDIIATTATA